MRYIGILLIIIGGFAFFRPGQIISWRNQSLYKGNPIPQKTSHITGVRILAALWVAVGILLFLNR